MPDFQSRWRGFLRDCALVLLPGLPPETQEWVSGADKFEAGQLGLEELTAIRVRAIRFQDARRELKPGVEWSALRVVMYRLWPYDPDRWHEEGWYLLRYLEEAGIVDILWWSLLRNRFNVIFG